MAYQWFTRPLWAWLKDPGDVSLMSAVDLIDLDGHGLVTSMRELAANVTWEARQSSMTMLDSHDTARLRTVVGGDRRRHLVALAALFTLPGVPTLFAGSEVGCEGDTMDTTRVPFPWDRLGVLDEHTPIGDRDRDRDRDDDGAEVDDGAAGADLADRRFLADVGALIALRRNSVPLRHGSLRWLDATAESVTYARETDAEVTVVHLVRAPMTTRALAAAQLGVRLDHPCEGDPAGDSEDARPPVLQFGTPVELVMPDRIVLPGTPGATIVSFPRPRIPVASGRHHAGPHGATTPWATPMAATKHPDSVE